MVAVDTLNLVISDHRIVYDGKEINNIFVENENAARRTVAMCPKHRQSFLYGNLMVSKTRGIVYVPLDEVNTSYESIDLRPDGTLSKTPTLSYEDYLKEREAFYEKQFKESCGLDGVSKK